MSRWRAEYDDGIWRFYRDGMELGLYEKGDVVIDALNNAESRIAELEAESERFTVHSHIERQDAEERAHLEKLVPDLKKRIAELEEDNRSFGDSNMWLKQNYEDLERDYGTMYDKMCARIDKLTAENKVLEDACEILRKQNKRLFSKVFSNAYRKECAE